MREYRSRISLVMFSWTRPASDRETTEALDQMILTRGSDLVPRENAMVNFTMH